MSVLACTIGALTLLLLSLSLSSVGSSRLADQAESAAASPGRAEGPPPAEGAPNAIGAAERERLERELDRLERAEQRWAELEAALESRGLASEAEGGGLEALRREVARRQGQARRRAALEEVEGSLAEIRKQRDSVEASIEVLESRRKTLPILIDPTGLSRGQKPFFIECDEDGLTAYRATDDFEYFVPLEEVGNHGDFSRYLRRIRATPGALLVLLVRPEGIAAMERAALLARAAGVRLARMPLPGDGELDWRLLREAEAAERRRSGA